MPERSRGGGQSLVSVLVVDDQATYRAAMRELVEATPGLELVGEAESGEAAVALAVERSPQLVLMDKRMPGMGGLAACRAITDRAPDTIVILCSVEDPDPVTAEAHGAEAMLRKQDLSRERLREILSAHGSRN